MKNGKKLFGMCAVVGGVSLIVVADGIRPVVSDPIPELDAASVKTELADFLPRYILTLEGDGDQAITDLYVADDRFTWFTDGKALYTSSQDVVESLDGLEASGVELRTELAGTTIVPLSRSLAAISSEFSTRATANGLQAFTFAGVITMVVERQPDGVWKVVRGHSSTPAGPPQE